MIVSVSAAGFMLKTILQLLLRVGREAIGRSNVDPAQIFTPANVMPVAITDGAEELLVPPKRAKQLRGKFVFGFHIISECICVSHSCHFKARFIELRPDLQMTPGKAGILPKDKFTIIIDVTSWRQRGCAFAPKRC